MGRETKTGDFLIIDTIQPRPEIDYIYRTICPKGFTTDTEGILKIADRMIQLTQPQYECQSTVEAIGILRESGWVVLQFLS